MTGSLSALLILLIGLCLPSLCRAQSSGEGCDFSSYKPLVVSRSLADAATQKVAPTWPPMGHGTAPVKVKILVDREGNVTRACAVGGHPLLRRPARAAALGWKFKPNFGLSKRPRRKYARSHLVFIFSRAAATPSPHPGRRSLRVSC
jgi:hypothetical protein